MTSRAIGVSAARGSDIAREDAPSRWLSWTQAADLAGCPASTIEWYVRLGRIERRPMRGHRPTLLRTSVEEFASWYLSRSNERLAKRRDRKSRRKESVAAQGPTGWITTAEASRDLDRSHDQVLHLIATGRLRGLKRFGRWWLDPQSVEAIVIERAGWVSYATAAELANVSPTTVSQAVRRSEIDHRDAPQQVPSLERGSVLEFAQRRRARQRREQESRSRATELHAAQSRDQLLDPQFEWLDAAAVAVILGISRVRVGQLVRADRLPHHTAHGRRWYRADHTRLIKSARDFQTRTPDHA